MSSTWEPAACGKRPPRLPGTELRGEAAPPAGRQGLLRGGVHCGLWPRGCRRSVGWSPHPHQDLYRPCGPSYRGTDRQETWPCEPAWPLPPQGQVEALRTPPPPAQQCCGEMQAERRARERTSARSPWSLSWGLLVSRGQPPPCEGLQGLREEVGARCEGEFGARREGEIRASLRGGLGLGADRMGPPPWGRPCGAAHTPSPRAWWGRTSGCRSSCYSCWPLRMTWPWPPSVPWTSRCLRSDSQPQ